MALGCETMDRVDIQRHNTGKYIEDQPYSNRYTEWSKGERYAVQNSVVHERAAGLNTSSGKYTSRSAGNTKREDRYKTGVYRRERKTRRDRLWFQRESDFFHVGFGGYRPVVGAE